MRPPSLRPRLRFAPTVRTPLLPRHGPALHRAPKHGALHLRHLAPMTTTAVSPGPCACSGGPTTPRRKRAYVALGSNVGDRVAMIERACREMDVRGVRVVRTSGLWETAPMYVLDQDKFINGVCEVRTSLSPFPAGGAVYIGMSRLLTVRRSRPISNPWRSWTSCRISNRRWEGKSWSTRARGPLISTSSCTTTRRSTTSGSRCRMSGSLSGNLC